MPRAFGGGQAGEGGIASHFHLAADGTGIVNYGEWTAPEAHRRTAGAVLRSDGDVAALIRSVDGLRPKGFHRFLPHRGLSRPTAGEPPGGAELT